MTFEEFKNTHFVGDEEKALAHLAYEAVCHVYPLSGSYENLNAILGSMDKRIADRYFAYFKAEMDRNPEIAKKAEKLAYLLESIRMTSEQVKTSKKNPFVKRSLILLLGFVLAFVIFAVLLYVRKEYGIDNSVLDFVIEYGFTIFTGCNSIALATALMNASRFKKAKRLIEKMSKDGKLQFENAVSNNAESSAYVTSEMADKANSEYEEAVTVTPDKIRSEFASIPKWILVFMAVMAVLGYVSAAIIAFSGQFAVTIVGILCGVFFNVLHIVVNRKIKNAEKYDFYLEKERVIDKKITKNDSNITFRFYFEKSGKYVIDTMMRPYLAKEMNEKLNIGNEAYLLHLGTKKYIYRVYFLSDKFAWDEFYEKDGKYYPVKRK